MFVRSRPGKRERENGDQAKELDNKSGRPNKGDREKRRR